MIPDAEDVAFFDVLAHQHPEYPAVVIYVDGGPGAGPVGMLDSEGNWAPLEEWERSDDLDQEDQPREDKGQVDGR